MFRHRSIFQFISDIFFKLSHLHCNKSTIHPHLLKDFSLYSHFPHALIIITKPCVFCLSLVCQPPEPRGRGGWGTCDAVTCLGLLPLAFCLAHREQTQSQVWELTEDTYLKRLNGLTHLPWPWRHSLYSHSYTTLATLQNNPSSCVVAAGSDVGLALWAKLPPGTVRTAWGGVGHNRARDMPAILQDTWPHAKVQAWALALFILVVQTYC